MTSLLRSPAILVLTGILLSATIAGFLAIPPETLLPIHWGPDGTADAFWPRNRALFLAPVAVALILTLSAFAERFAPKPEIRAGRHVTAVTVSGILALFAAIQTVIVLIGLGFDLSMSRVIAFGMGLLAIVVGNVLPKSQPNSLAGMRLPWTLKDAKNWRATHRLTGGLMVATGALQVALSLALPTGMLLAFTTVAAMVGPVSIGCLYSYSFSRGRRPGTP
ncbi:SdpI family protein [Ensifer sp.]|jgi:uncharacterized membrane protein|uniref:SdpI family protein n=1 Tax=Ensifer sp. TaxID=1872086 RepID=UPI002E16511E|nr:SdpI family protein [Ensifer sp.]